MYRGSPKTGELRREIHWRNLFKSSQARLHSSSQRKVFTVALRALKNGKHRSADLEINLPKAAIHPSSLCTSLTQRGSNKFFMTLIFSRFASIPHSVIMNPRNFPDLTPKVHFIRFSFKSNFHKVSKVSSKSVKCLLSCLVLITISST